MYRPTQRQQIGDPTTTLDSYICTMESGAMALDFHTLGKLKLWGGNLVTHCGRAVSDIIGKGTNLNNLQTAWKYYGYTLTIRSGHTFNDMLADIRAGRGVVLQGDYDQFSLATRCQDNFTGNHAIYVNPEGGTTTLLMMDPLCKEPKYVPINELRNYAEKLGRAALGASSPQKIFYAVTDAHPGSNPPPVVTPPPTPPPVVTPPPVTPPATATYRISIAPHTTVLIANFNASGQIASWSSRIWGATSSGAPCGAPQYRRGSIRGGATVVYVPKGVFANKYVRVGNGVTLYKS